VAAAVASTLAAGCGASSHPLATSHVAVDPPGGGVVFSYPAPGQFDVPLGARILLTFTGNLPATVDTACTRTGGQLQGALCVEGPGGFVPGTVEVHGGTLAFTPAGGLAPGTTYRVWASPALLPGATNLSATAPLLTFRSRSTRPRGGEAATILTWNGLPPNADGTSAQPTLDAAPIRLLFSEPLDPRTVNATSVRLVHAADGVAVDAVPVVHGVHLTLQPDQPLAAGEPYRVELTQAVRDVGGEPIAPATLSFTPRRMAPAGAGLYPLPLNVVPAWTDGVGQPSSRLGAAPVNASILSSQLIGTNTLGAVAGGLDVGAGDPQVMGTPLPMLIPRGQRLDLTGMAIRYGGAIASGIRTGTVHFTMLTDAVGFLMRNPYRDPAQEPDDVQSPTWVDFTMDAVLTGEDAHGNTVATQTVMGIRVLGLSTLDGEELAIEQVGAMDFDLVGVDTAPIGMALRLRTGTRAPTPELGLPFLVSSYPAAGAVDVSPGEPIELNFSGPMDPARIRDGIEVTLAQGGAPIPASTRLEGSTLVVVPSQRLTERTTFTLSYSGLRSIGGAGVAGGSLSFTTSDSTAPQPVPPIVTALVPGAPCALTGASATSGGACAGGKASDAPYQPFALPANREVRVVFSEPVDPASLTLGAACGQGSVRVETLGAGGACAGVVAGSLVKRDREVRFVPTAPWTPGAAYRLTLVAGANTACDAGEICGRNGRPLNTDPLAGAGTNAPAGSSAAGPSAASAAAAGGGPDLVVPFTGAPATPDTYQPLASDPIADRNGNGFLDATERVNDANRAVMEIVKIGGIITNAALTGVDCLAARAGTQTCSYLNATLPSSIGGVLPSCPVDAQGQPSSAANPCLEVRVFPSAILGTSISMNTTALGLVPINDVSTGMMLMRLRETGGPLHGYILREPGVADPQFVIDQDLYLDAPDMKLPIFGTTHDLQSKPLHATLKGPVTFGADGRMNVALRSTADVNLTVNISALGLPGHIDLRIPAGEMRVTLSGPPLR
jgi:hypothetical protein